MTYILFTRGNNWYSDLLCGILQEPVSHVSIYQDRYVYHSDLLGVRQEPYKTFSKRQKLELRVKVDRIDELEAKYEVHKNSLYDVGAAVFIGLAFLARRYLRMPMPKSNLWQTTGMFMCTEWTTEVEYDAEDSMITPYGLYRKLRDEQY